MPPKIRRKTLVKSNYAVKAMLGPLSQPFGGTSWLIELTRRITTFIPHRYESTEPFQTCTFLIDLNRTAVLSSLFRLRATFADEVNVLNLLYEADRKHQHFQSLDSFRAYTCTPASPTGTEFLSAVCIRLAALATRQHVRSKQIAYIGNGKAESDT